MTETARTERAKVVAYLRRLAKCHEAIEAGGSMTNPALYEHAMSTRIAYEMAADSVEAGEHLKKPEPSIPASEWVKEPNLGH